MNYYFIISEFIFYFAIHKQNIMDNKEKIDLRDAILLHLEQIERPMSWLSDKADIPYPTIYALLKQRTFAISDRNLAKINRALDTDFINDQNS